MVLIVGLGVSSIFICTSIHNWNLRLVLHRCQRLLISVIYLLFIGIMIMIPPPPPPLPAYPASPFPFPLAQILQYCIVDNLKIGDIRLFKNHYFANNKGQTLTMVHWIAQIHTTPQGKEQLEQNVIILQHPFRNQIILFLRYYTSKLMFVIPKVGLTARLCSQPVNYIFC